MITKNLPTILIVESRIDQVARLSSELNNFGFNTFLASNEIMVYEKIQLFNPQIILIINNMKDNFAKNIFINIQKKFILECNSIIILSQDNIDDKIFFLTSGANDFIYQPINYSELIARINIQLKILNKCKELQKSNSILQEQNIICKRLAMTDELTGLYNKRYLVDRLKIELKYSQKCNRPLTLLMIDIDHFKNINDTYGHLTGDRVLKETANTIYKFLRESDIFVRYGGEEFVIVLPNTSLSTSKLIAERIRKKVSQSMIKLNLFKVNVTISIGLSKYSANKNEKPTDEINRLIHEADLALYSAKTSGRNRTVIYPFKLLNPNKIFDNNFTILNKKKLIKNTIGEKLI